MDVVMKEALIRSLKGKSKCHALINENGINDDYSRCVTKRCVESDWALGALQV